MGTANRLETTNGRFGRFSSLPRTRLDANPRIVPQLGGRAQFVVLDQLCPNEGRIFVHACKIATVCCCRKRKENGGIGGLGRTRFGQCLSAAHERAGSRNGTTRSASQHDCQPHSTANPGTGTGNIANEGPTGVSTWWDKDTNCSRWP